VVCVMGIGGGETGNEFVDRVAGVYVHVIGKVAEGKVALLLGKNRHEGQHRFNVPVSGSNLFLYVIINLMLSLGKGSMIE
jgi:hypothetical protein